MNPRMMRLLLALLLGASPLAHAQLGLSPNYFDLSEKEAQRTQSFRVTNFGGEAVKIRTELLPFDIDEKGQVAEIAPHPRSLERHVAISPIEFEIPAGGSQVVRFALRPAQPLEPGEYRGMVYFRLGGTANVGDKIRFPVAYRLGGAVYVQVGNPVRSATLESIATRDGTSVDFTLRATGSANTRMSGRYVVWKKDAWRDGAALPPLPQEGKPVPAGLVMNGAIPARPVLPGKTVTYSSPLSEDQKRLPPGEYVLQVAGKLERETVERVIPFRVTAATQ